ncbi:MAG TPA: hypothetical protein VFA20_12065 [Myxococcaceae bacterium]|nr:hypothetical protein [Myxococcaceae bacterium]
MPACQVVVQTQSAPGGPTATLANAWVYWREGGNLTVLRTNQDGRLVSLSSGGDATRPWDYGPFFTTTTGTQVELFHGLGARPAPSARLSDPPNVFAPRTIALPATPVATPTPVAPTSPNTLTAVPTAVVVIPAMPIRLTNPVELSLWPVLWEPASGSFATDGLNQGAALWTGAGLTVTENGPAAAPAAGVRPKERGLRVAGTVAAGATGVKLQVLDRNGSVLALRQTSASTTDVTEIAGTLGAAAGADRPFEATLYFARPADAFGAVQIAVRPDGLTPAQMASFACHLVGVQIALVADTANGQSRNPPRGEAQEVIIVDFLDSPQPTQPAISAETRARRMLAYDITNRQRPLAPGSATQVDTPEMPMWMAELHLLGLDQAALEDLLLRRPHLATPRQGTLELSLSWTLDLSWDGPDVGTGSPRLYQYNASFPGTQAVRLALDAQNHVAGVGSSGDVTGAITPAPAQLSFPVSNRRLPLVVVNGQSRAWGRQSGATSREALLVEWQPAIVSGTTEIIRGGDGRIALASLSVDGRRADAGVFTAPASGAGGSTAAGSTADAELPTFRVRGVNPPVPATALIDALVEEYVNAHAAVASVTALTLACWQQTVRLILAHEAGHQFEHRGAGRRRYAGQYHGHEQDMPIFGPPHGYGYGQHDNPPVSDDGAWSVVANIRESVRRVIQDKGGSAWGLISGHLPAAMNQRTRAAYQRELVRRYNGGTELRWNATSNDWEIFPTVAQWANNADHSQGANPRLLYPNNVLGTAVVYSNGAGAAATFPWPIAFTAASYGPGT